MEKEKILSPLGLLILEDEERRLSRKVGNGLFTDASTYHRIAASHHKDEIHNLLTSDIFRCDKPKKGENIWALWSIKEIRNTKQILVGNQ
jgi:hypothetical protein